MLEQFLTQENITISLHLTFAMLAGAIIGFERSYYGRPAGFRTHTLVCLSSALLMVVTTSQWQWMAGASPDVINTDPTRMAQGIMTGIGFLGAGVIYKEGITVRGLTTAASIWITAAIGILFGVGLYVPAVMATVAAIGVLSLFHRVERWMPKHYYIHFNISFQRQKRMNEEGLRKLLKDFGFSIGTISYHIIEEGKVAEYRTVVRTRKQSAVKQLAEHLTSINDVHEFRISPSGD